MSNTEGSTQTPLAIPRTPSPCSSDRVTSVQEDLTNAQLISVNCDLSSHDLNIGQSSGRSDDAARPQLSPYVSDYASLSSHKDNVISTEKEPTNTQTSLVTICSSSQDASIGEGSLNTATSQLSLDPLQYSGRNGAISAEGNVAQTRPSLVIAGHTAHYPSAANYQFSSHVSHIPSQFKTRADFESHDDFIDYLCAENNFAIPGPPKYRSRDDARDDLSRPDWDLRKDVRRDLELRMRPCWIDQDNSGDYDPNSEFSEPKVFPSCPKRLRLIRPGEDTGDPLPKKPRTSTWQSGRNEGLSLSIVIKVTSDEGIAFLTALKQVSKFPDNWPETKPKGAVEQLNFTELHPESIQPQRLRQRNRSGLQSSLLQEEKIESPSLANVSLGHPAAQGCKSCFEINLRCSLLTEGEKYPCRECKEDDVDCELVVQPLKKRACESCRRRKIVCSYRITENHSQPCRDCLLSGYKCVAGPLTGRTRTGPSLDSDIKQFVPTPERPYKSCAGCRKLRKRCSLETNLGYHGCTRCADLGQECTFEALHKRDQKTLKKLEAKDINISPDLPTPTAGITKIIKTRFAHPISFNYDPPEDGIDPCHWCENLSYGMIGLPQAHVEVIDYQDGKGYIEIDSGHTSFGHPPARMCRRCTLAKMLIIGCSAHEIRPIGGVISDMVAYTTLMDWMESGKAADAPFEWCSICPLQAFYECGTAPISEMTFDEEEVLSGCGLKLCAYCADGLLTHNGHLTNYLVFREEEDDDHHDPSLLRADACFLRSDGHLLNRFFI